MLDWAHLTGETRRAPGGLGDFAWRFATWPAGDWIHFEIKPPEKRGSLTPHEAVMLQSGGLIVVTSGREALQYMEAHSAALGLRPRFARA